MEISDLGYIIVHQMFFFGATLIPEHLLKTLKSVNKTLKWIKRKKEKCALNNFKLTYIFPHNHVPSTEIED